MEDKPFLLGFGNFSGESWLLNFRRVCFSHWSTSDLPQHLGVSKKRGTPKWMIYNGKPWKTLLKLMIPREDWGTLGNIRETPPLGHPPLDLGVPFFLEGHPFLFFFAQWDSFSPGLGKLQVLWTFFGEETLNKIRSKKQHLGTT